MLDNYSGGQYVAAKTERLIPLFDPCSGSTYDEVPASGVEDVSAACESAAMLNNLGNRLSRLGVGAHDTGGALAAVVLGRRPAGISR